MWSQWPEVRMAFNVNNVPRAPGRVATPPLAGQQTLVLPAALSSDLRTLAACPGVTSMTAVEDMLLRSELYSAQSVECAVNAFSALDRATHQIRRDDDCKRKQKKVRLLLRDRLLWRAFGCKADMLDKSAIFDLFRESFRGDVESQLDNSYCKIQEKLLRELICSSFPGRLAAELRHRPDLPENREALVNLHEAFRELFSSSASSSGSAESHRSTSSGQSEPESPAAQAEGDQHQEEGEQQQQQQHEETDDQQHQDQDLHWQSEQQQDESNQRQQQGENDQWDQRQMRVKNTFLEYDEDDDKSKYSKGWKSCSPKMQQWQQAGTDCSATDAGTQADFRAWHQNNEPAADCAATDAGTQAEFNECHEETEGGQDRSCPQQQQQQSVPAISGDTTVIIEALCSRLAAETRPSSCGQLARMIVELMPQVATNSEVTQNQVVEQLAKTVRICSKHGADLKTVLKALASCSGLRFVSEAFSLRDCVAPDLLAETWHGCVQSATRSSAKISIPYKCIELAGKFLDIFCVQPSSSDAQSVRHSCEALGKLVRARMQDGEAPPEELLEKLCEVMDKFSHTDTKVLECCMWELVKLYKHCSLGLRISVRESICHTTACQEMRHEQLLRSLEKCSNPLRKLVHQLYARRHPMCSIVRRLAVQSSEDVADVLPCILDDVRFVLSQPVKMFMDSNDGEVKPDRNNSCYTPAERKFAHDVVAALFKQRVQLPEKAVPGCLQWAKSSWQRIDMRLRFVLVGILFGESALLRQLADPKILQEENGEDVLVAVIRALQDLTVLHTFDQEVLSQGLRALLDINVGSRGRLGSALASGMATLFPENPSPAAMEETLDKLLSLSTGQAREFGRAAFMHEVSWSLHSILSKAPNLAGSQVRAVKLLSEEIQKSYHEEAQATKYASEIAQLISGMRAS
eukprot:TRINITY_DN28669_c0_g2_i1.p1 TRINITY_DN28669_c0_g2~~TRINITY_DN28669_c0_g2_i1.p1  ORF type:complete len:917 (-),score=211.76 TRINITY_DN28669_c0_g2_i1:254-3004(-)